MLYQHGQHVQEIFANALFDVFSRPVHQDAKVVAPSGCDHELALSGFRHGPRTFAAGLVDVQG